VVVGRAGAAGSACDCGAAGVWAGGTYQN
jgi:hypothetical protein